MAGCGYGLVPGKALATGVPSTQLASLKDLITLINTDIKDLAGAAQQYENRRVAVPGALAHANHFAALGSLAGSIVAGAGAIVPLAPHNAVLTALSGENGTIFTAAGAYQNPAAQNATTDTFMALPFSVNYGARQVELAAVAVGQPLALDNKDINIGNMEGLEWALEELFIPEAPLRVPPAAFKTNQKFKPSAGILQELPAGAIPAAPAAPVVLKKIMTWCLSKLQAPPIGGGDAAHPPVAAGGIAYNMYEMLKAIGAGAILTNAGAGVSAMHGGARRRGRKATTKATTKAGSKKTSGKKVSKKGSQTGGAKRKAKKASKKASKKSSKRSSLKGGAKRRSSKKASKKASKKVSKKSSKRNSMKGGAKRRASKKTSKKTSKGKTRK